MRSRRQPRGIPIPSPLPSSQPLAARERLRIARLERAIRRGHRRAVLRLSTDDSPVGVIACPDCGRDLHTVGAVSLHLAALHSAVLDLAAQADWLRHELVAREQERPA